MERGRLSGKGKGREIDNVREEAEVEEGWKRERSEGSGGRVKGKGEVEEVDWERRWGRVKWCQHPSYFGKITIIIHMNQGQTFDKTGLFLLEAVFVHGQLDIVVLRLSDFKVVLVNTDIAIVYTHLLHR